MNLAKTRDLYAEGPVTIGLKGGPGRISVRLDGFIMSYNDTCPCNWMFKGKVSIRPDPFNFDSPLDTGRTGPGMVITTAVWLFQNGTGNGHDFTIFFDGFRNVEASGTCPKNIYQDPIWIPAG